MRMRLPLTRAIGELRGRSTQRLVGLLSRHVDTVLDGARWTQRAVRAQVGWHEAHDALVLIERSAADLHSAHIAEVAGAIITPIDREDLIRVSRSTHDVVENLSDFTRQCGLFGVPHTPVMPPIADAVEAGVVTLAAAIAAIAGTPRDITERASMIRRAGRDVRRAYDEAIARLFEGEVDMAVLKTREALRRLDVVGLRIGEAADALTDAAVKRNIA